MKKMKSRKHSSERGNIILCVQSLKPMKNLKNVISAFKKSNLRDYNLVIIDSKSKDFSVLDSARLTA